MRIMHAIQVFAAAGGAQSYVRRLVELQRDAGHEVAVLHADDGGAPLRGIATRSTTSDAEAGAFVASFDPEVVHVHDLGLPAELEDRLVAALPVVRSLHDLGYTCAAGTRYLRNGAHCTRAHGPGCLPTTALRGCAHRLDLRPILSDYRELRGLLPRLRATPTTLVHSEYMAGLLRLNGFAPDRVYTARYFVEPPGEAPSLPEERVVAFVGRVVRNKGLDVLLRALASLGAAWDGLVVCGDGWELERCRRLAERLGIAAKVDFRGWTTRDDALAAVGASSVLALPSRWPEPFGIAGLEAMALARPVVASRGGGIPEWLDDGETGLLVPPGDARALAAALERVLSDRELAGRMGEAGRPRAADFSPAEHLRKLDGAYQVNEASILEAVAG